MWKQPEEVIVIFQSRVSVNTMAPIYKFGEIKNKNKHVGWGTEKQM